MGVHLVAVLGVRHVQKMVCLCHQMVIWLALLLLQTVLFHLVRKLLIPQARIHIQMIVIILNRKKRPKWADFIIFQ